jgi:hypothetical protein
MVFNVPRAKIEMVIFLRELLARVDEIALTGEPAWIENLVLGRPEAIADRLQGVGGCDGVRARHAPATWSDTFPDRDQRAFGGDQMRHVIHLAVDSDRPHIWVGGESGNHASRMRDIGVRRREA